MSGPQRGRSPFGYTPTAGEVDALIRRADGHALGTGFLRDGALDAVAATFGVHAFTVDAARERLSAAEPAATA